MWDSKSASRISGVGQSGCIVSMCCRNPSTFANRSAAVIAETASRFALCKPVRSRFTNSRRSSVFMTYDSTCGSKHANGYQHIAMWFSTDSVGINELAAGALYPPNRGQSENKSCIYKRQIAQCIRHPTGSGHPEPARSLCSCLAIRMYLEGSEYVLRAFFCAINGKEDQ